MASRFVTWFKYSRALDYMHTAYNAELAIWNLYADDQTDWIIYIQNITADLYIVRKQRTAAYTMETELAIELYNGHELVYEGPMLENPTAEFPEWYHETFHPHMFLTGNDKNIWNICPQNQLDWRTTLTYHSGFWLVESSKEEGCETTVRAYAGPDNLIFEWNR
jgi:hypothetical protein